MVHYKGVYKGTSNEDLEIEEKEVRIEIEHLLEVYLDKL